VRQTERGEEHLLHEVNWKIGGVQGEGIDSTGDIMALVCNGLGYHIYSNRVFSSRIKGGHTSAKVRIATRPVAAPVQETHVLVALDQESIDKSAAELNAGSCVIADSGFKPCLPSGSGATVIALALTALAREIQAPILKNTVALGASAELLGFPLEEVQAYTATRFGRKGGKVVEGNAKALAAGAGALRQYLDEHLGGRSPLPPLAPGDGRQRLVISGNHAVAMGAVAAGCRLMATYPITPAYEVMDALVPIFPQVGGAVVQMEDELASLAFCIGAGFAGARSFTATSGPGLSLMQENLGLAAITETPLVIVDVQRGGPSSGLPTKHEQSDLLAMLHGTHGDAPRIVLAPGDVAEAFHDTVLAFNLADRLHTPVIVASDLSLGLWKQTLEEADVDIERVEIDRGPSVSDAELAALGPGGFSRYAWVPGGVSPRSLPGQKYGQFQAAGVEHNPKGNVTEDSANRVRMMRKRAMKFADVEDLGVPGLVYEGPDEPELVLVAYGSTSRSVLEGAEILRAEGVTVGTVRLRVLAPFPIASLADILGPARVALFVENNFGAQLAGLVRFHGLEGRLAARGRCEIRSLLKFDGFQFYSAEVAAGARETLKRPPTQPGFGPAEPFVMAAGLTQPVLMSAI